MRSLVILATGWQYGSFAVLMILARAAIDQSAPLRSRAHLWGRHLALRESSGHRYIVAPPMFHMNATISVKSGLGSGGCIVLLPSFRSLDYVRAIDKHKVT